MQRTYSRAESLQAVGDSAEAAASDGGLLPGSLARRHEVPLLLQEVAVDPFAWD
ncbi:hypothetical protein LINPERHAP1_LOCUS26920 [Linum perenne]